MSYVGLPPSDYDYPAPNPVELANRREIIDVMLKNIQEAREKIAYKIITEIKSV